MLSLRALHDLVPFCFKMRAPVIQGVFTTASITDMLLGKSFLISFVPLLCFFVLFFLVFFVILLIPFPIVLPLLFQTLGA
jgi:hypothetical protein